MSARVSRVVGVLLVSALVMAAGSACGGDDGGSDRAAFCGSAADLPSMAPTSGEAARFESMAGNAPEEVAEPAEVLARVAEGLEGGEIEVDPDDPSAALGFLRDLDLDVGDVAQASQRVESYVARECGAGGEG